jgi:hypothetical protein
MVKTLEKAVAKSISYLFHPLVMPVLGLLALFASGSYLSFLPFQVKKWLLLIVGLFTFLAPALLIPVYLLQKVISNIEVSQRKDRIIPLSITVILYGVAVFFIFKYPIPRLIQSFMLGSFISVLVALFVSMKWKISIHMIGIGGLTGLLSAAYALLSIEMHLFLMGSILIAGLVGTARLILNEHNLTQIFGGFFTGFFVVYLCLILV